MSSHDVTATILVCQSNETAAMLMSQTNDVGVELFSHVNTLSVPIKMHDCRPLKQKLTIFRDSTVRCGKITMSVWKFVN